VVSESRVMLATSVPILVFIGLSLLDLGPMYATDRQTDVRQHHHLMSPLIMGGGIIIIIDWSGLFRCGLRDLHQCYSR